MDYLDRFEGEVNEAEAHILSGTQATKKDVLHRIIAWRAGAAPAKTIL